MSRSVFTERVIEIVRSIPAGTVSTYGGVAELAGNPRAARQVSRILHSCSTAEKLPWHRVVNKNGKISLKPGRGYEEQKMLLEDEGVAFYKGCIELETYLWRME